MTDRVLFIDDAQVQSMEGLQRCIHPGEKFDFNPVLRCDRAWESGQAMLGTVMKEEGVYRMWYGSGVGQHGDNKGRLWHMYAESDDGIEWRLPSLGQFTDHSGANLTNADYRPTSRTIS